jgi:hypothetical protein
MSYFIKLAKNIKSNHELYKKHPYIIDKALLSGEINISQYFDLYDELVIMIMGNWHKIWPTSPHKKLIEIRKIIIHLFKEIHKLRLSYHLSYRNIKHIISQGNDLNCMHHATVNAIDILVNGYKMSDKKHMEYKQMLFDELKLINNTKKMLKIHCSSYKLYTNLSIVKFLKGLYLAKGVGLLDYWSGMMLHATAVYVKGKANYYPIIVDSKYGKKLFSKNKIVFLNESKLNIDKLLDARSQRHIISNISF